MRTRHWLIGLVGGSALVAAVGGGCGGSTDNNPGGGDAGNDTTTNPMPDVITPVDQSVSMDTGVTPADAGPDVCSVDADLNTIAPPDAALLADASVGTCISCTRTSCMGGVTACNADCACKSALTDFITCVANGSPFTTCASAAETEPAAQSLAACILLSCTNACGIGGLLGGGDSGSDAQATDAPATMEAGD